MSDGSSFSGNSFEQPVDRDGFKAISSKDFPLTENYRKYRLDRILLFMGENISVFVATIMFLLLFIGIMVSVIALIVTKEFGYIEKFLEYSFVLIMNITGFICGKHIKSQKLDVE